MFPSPPRPAARLPAWFGQLADVLLNRCRLVVRGQPHRIVEVEAYYHSAPHPDPFPHKNPTQWHTGRWYFHRTGEAYRGGSFKGLDVSIGGRGAYGGMLLRGLEAPNGTLLDGPSLLVDHLLKLTGRPTVAALDTTLGERLAWDRDSPVSLLPADTDPRPVVQSLRVGLGLKRFRPHPDDPALKYLFRPYRFLTAPRRTKKGKPHMVLPLLAGGTTAAAVTRITGCPPAAVKRYAAALAAGRAETTAEPYYGRDWTTDDLCRLYGRWCERGLGV